MVNTSYKACVILFSFELEIELGLIYFYYNTRAFPIFMLCHPHMSMCMGCNVLTYEANFCQVFLLYKLLYYV